MRDQVSPNAVGLLKIIGGAKLCKGLRRRIRQAPIGCEPARLELGQGQFVWGRQLLCQSLSALCAEGTSFAVLHAAAEALHCGPQVLAGVVRASLFSQSILEFAGFR